MFHNRPKWKSEDCQKKRPVSVVETTAKLSNKNLFQKKETNKNKYSKRYSYIFVKINLANIFSKSVAYIANAALSETRSRLFAEINVLSAILSVVNNIEFFLWNAIGAQDYSLLIDLIVQLTFARIRNGRWRFVYQKIQRIKNLFS